jgi:hypothetical protein
VLRAPLQHTPPGPIYLRTAPGPQRVPSTGVRREPLGDVPRTATAPLAASRSPRGVPVSSAPRTPRTAAASSTRGGAPCQPLPELSPSRSAPASRGPPLATAACTHSCTRDSHGVLGTLLRRTTYCHDAAVCQPPIPSWHHALYRLGPADVPCFTWCHGNARSSTTRPRGSPATPGPGPATSRHGLAPGPPPAPPRPSRARVQRPTSPRWLGPSASMRSPRPPHPTPLPVPLPCAYRASSPARDRGPSLGTRQVATPSRAGACPRARILARGALGPGARPVR